MAQSDPDFQLKCQIIQEVQQRPLLYNKGHPKYQITSCRNEEMAHIAVAVGKTSKEVSTIWKNLLDAYRKKVKWFIRTTTNVPTQNNQAQVTGDAGAEGGGDAATSTSENPEGNANETANAQSYDAKRSRNTLSSSKRRQEMEHFQNRLLKTLEGLGPNEPAVVEKKEYVDVAFAAIAMKMKSTLSQNEIMDLVEDIQQLVNRACREKRRRMDLSAQQPPPPLPVTASTSTDMMYGGPPGPQAPMAHPVAGYNKEPNYFNF